MYRIIQWATGSMGAAIVRGVLDHPDLEMVGAYVYSDSKSGVDVGTLVGRPAAGVHATNNVEAILAADADVVVHAGRVGPYGSHDEDIIRLLESGKNVISINGYTYTEYWNNERSKRLQEACIKGNSTLCGAGLNPGFIAEQVATLVTGLSSSVDHVEIVESADATKLRDPNYLFDALGFGADPKIRSANDPSWLPVAAFNGMYEETIGLVAYRLGMTLDRVEGDHIVHTAKADIPVYAGIVRAGTVSHTNWRWHGIVGGKRRLTLSIHWYVDPTNLDEPNPPLWKVNVTGHPGARISINVEKHPDDRSKMSPEQYAVAARVINLIPLVVAAKPGLMRLPTTTPFRDDYLTSGNTQV